MKFTANRRKKFLEGLVKWGNVTPAAHPVDVSRQYVYMVRAEDEEFANGMDEAIAESREVLEAEAWRRANDGCAEPVVSMGRVVMVPDPDNRYGSPIPLRVRKYSDTLMIKLQSSESAIALARWRRIR
jgi:hypothetical protein